MKIWVDAQLSPVIAQWLSATYGVEAVAVRDLRLRDARDRDIFFSAREANAIVPTKDRGEKTGTFCISGGVRMLTRVFGQSVGHGNSKNGECPRPIFGQEPKGPYALFP